MKQIHSAIGKIAETQGDKGRPKNHCKTCQKRSAHRLFDGGKKDGLKALVYMHRYQPDTIAGIRTDYVHEQQSRYRIAIADMESRVANVANGERVKLNKVLTRLTDQDTDLRSYEKKFTIPADWVISTDLGDGVECNCEARQH